MLKKVGISRLYVFLETKGFGKVIYGYLFIYLFVLLCEYLIFQRIILHVELVIN